MKEGDNRRREGKSPFVFMDVIKKRSLRKERKRKRGRDLPYAELQGEEKGDSW